MSALKPRRAAIASSICPELNVLGRLDLRHFERVPRAAHLGSTLALKDDVVAVAVGAGAPRLSEQLVDGCLDRFEAHVHSGIALGD